MKAGPACGWENDARDGACAGCGRVTGGAAPPEGSWQAPTRASGVPTGLVEGVSCKCAAGSLAVTDVRRLAGHVGRGELGEAVGQ
jgi:hypothetical protein